VLFRSLDEVCERFAGEATLAQPLAAAQAVLGQVSDLQK